MLSVGAESFQWRAPDSVEVILPDPVRQHKSIVAIAKYDYMRQSTPSRAIRTQVMIQSETSDGMGRVSTQAKETRAARG